MVEIAWLYIGAVIGAIAGALLTRWWASQYLHCMHHASKGGWVADEDDKATSFVQATLIDTGMRKLFRCNACRKEWYR